jgi:hypothetical protein
MLALRRWTVVTVVLTTSFSNAIAFAETRIETGPDGVRYQVTRNVVERQVPTTVMQDRHQTTYAQQLTTNTLNQQQLYHIPVTSYQWDTRLRGRWNPFVTPYWTHDLRPVTTWTTQVASVQIPVNQVAWVPQTQTVQVPVTQYRTAQEETITRVALDPVSNNTSASYSAAQPLSQPSARIAVRPSTSTSIGGVALENDPPREATGGWQTPGGRY